MGPSLSSVPVEASSSGTNLSLRPNPVRATQRYAESHRHLPQVAVNDIGSSEDFLAAIDKTIGRTSTMATSSKAHRQSGPGRGARDIG